MNARTNHWYRRTVLEGLSAGVLFQWLFNSEQSDRSIDDSNDDGGDRGENAVVYGAAVYGTNR